MARDVCPKTSKAWLMAQETQIQDGESTGWEKQLEDEGKGVDCSMVTD